MPAKRIYYLCQRDSMEFIAQKWTTQNMAENCGSHRNELSSSTIIKNEIRTDGLT